MRPSHILYGLSFIVALGGIVAAGADQWWLAGLLVGGALGMARTSGDLNRA